MKKLMKKFERIMMAATFAEAGEHETARQIIREKEQEQPRKKDRPTVRPSTRMRAD